MAAAEAADAGLSTELLAALDTLRVAITLFDASERLTYCNQHFNYLFRSMPPREALIGRTYSEMIRLEVEGGEIAPLEADIESFVARRRAQFREGEFLPRDIQLADGRFVEIKARRTKTGGWIALWSDVTQARHTFMRQEDLVELSADAFAFWDRHDRLLLCNAAYAEIHGHSSGEFMLNTSFEELMRSAISRGKFVIEGDAETWIARRLDTHHSPAGALTIVTQSGDAYLVRDRATRDGGRATVYTDVTERHRAEAALGEQSRALERTKRALAKSQVQAKRQQDYLSDLTRRLDEAEVEVDTAKTALLRTMSHELKTPLNAIIGFAEVMIAERFGALGNERYVEYMKDIRASGERVIAIINDLLDLSRIETGKLDLAFSNQNLNDLVEQCVAVMQPQANRERIIIRTSLAQMLPQVMADARALRQITLNLIGNSIHLANAGGQVIVSTALSDFGEVVLRVRDTGHGLNDNEVAAAMEPFRTPAPSDQATDSSGVSLSLTKALVEANRAQFQIKTGGHSGTLIEVLFPHAMARA
jgi:signal transduction histidine kinase